MIDVDMLEVAIRHGVKIGRHKATIKSDIAIELITRLREAERDAARYRFMRDMSDEVDVSRFFYIDVSELDAEIDQAMKEKGDE